MHVAARLKPDLTGLKAAVDLWFARRVHGNLGVAQHYANCIEVVPVQDNGIVGCNLYLVNIYIFIVERKMVMRFGGEWNNRGRLRRKRQRIEKYKRRGQGRSQVYFS